MGTFSQLEFPLPDDCSLCPVNSKLTRTTLSQCQQVGQSQMLSHVGFQLSKRNLRLKRSGTQGSERCRVGLILLLHPLPPFFSLFPVRFLSCQRSPAAAILELFEEQNGSLQELHYLMTAMERLDCASAIQNYLNRTPRGSPAMMHGGAWENCSLQLDEKL